MKFYIHTYALTNFEAVATTMDKQMRLTHSVRALQAEQGHFGILWNISN